MATLTKAEREAVAAEAARRASREKESDDQKWLRGAIAETVREVLDDMFPEKEGDDTGTPGKKSNVSFLDNLLGNARTGS